MFKRELDRHRASLIVVVLAALAVPAGGQNGTDMTCVSSLLAVPPSLHLHPLRSPAPPFTALHASSSPPPARHPAIARKISRGNVLVIGEPPQGQCQLDRQLKLVIVWQRQRQWISGSWMCRMPTRAVACRMLGGGGRNMHKLHVLRSWELHFWVRVCVGQHGHGGDPPRGGDMHGLPWMGRGDNGGLGHENFQGFGRVVAFLLGVPVVRRREPRRELLRCFSLHIYLGHCMPAVPSVRRWDAFRLLGAECGCVRETDWRSGSCNVYGFCGGGRGMGWFHPSLPPSLDHPRTH